MHRNIVILLHVVLDPLVVEGGTHVELRSVGGADAITA